MQHEQIIRVGGLNTPSATCNPFAWHGVTTGFRGGFIFPTFFAGTAFGHAIYYGVAAIPNVSAFLGSVPPVLFCMTCAVGEHQHL